LRDIETTLDLCAQDLYRSGLKVMPKSTLAEANEKKDWHIYQDFAQVLMQKAKRLYEGEKLRIDLDEMIYAFDSSTIELCLKLCPWPSSITVKGIQNAYSYGPQRLHPNICPSHKRVRS
jgi:hypothetical protein